ncbi:MAG: KpsF/GutQ family sugar-phosphate isomerase [Candidatus Hydrogenedentota bacterium]
MDTLDTIRKALAAQLDGLAAIAGRAGERYVDAVNILFGAKGKVVVIGMGKCGHIGQKIAATLASTGTPAQFVHPAEAIHGDLGYIQPDDVLLVLSNSGETSEIAALLPVFARHGWKMVALTGQPKSQLAEAATVSLNLRVSTEGDSLGLAPMASTTVMLAVGDALAAALMHKRGFTREDYSERHPGGSLGQKLLSRVDTLMHTEAALPLCSESTLLREALVLITSKRLGTAFVVDEKRHLIGIVSDGDVRRIFQHDETPLERPVTEFMTHHAKTIHADMLAVDALRLMEDALITCLPVVDDSDAVIGALHIHDLVRAGIGEYPDFLKES